MIFFREPNRQVVQSLIVMIFRTHTSIVQLPDQMQVKNHLGFYFRSRTISLIMDLSNAFAYSCLKNLSITTILIYRTHY